ncbi:MAG: UPF0262 family protein [Hyphomicrobiales bacterium]|jgi:uncharacterized protein (UPF0262 family)|uniref:UPF0262 family protein n=1 Tax=Rhabdaerophilum calidifontis TaxID=2604328 RepID=UPI001239514E|nr:UPF0262 family protein [Rhabdaerophilum calidifontis]MCA1952939.1 UPF0262 family protein [Hyphomicrobiales bacterium]MCA1999602.1 UPF0262 family protein [Hyphomicrobiales bacterium]
MSGAGDLTRHRLVAVVLDETSIERGTPDQEHERQIAIYDLIEENRFAIPEHDGGPYALRIALVSGRLSFDIREEDGMPVVQHLLSLSPLRKVIKDYFLICESYYEAIRSASPERIEAIDMGRRGVHDEGAGLVIERLSGKIIIDHKTARRLFTLIAALSWKGQER